MRREGGGGACGTVGERKNARRILVGKRER